MHIIVTCLGFAGDIGYAYRNELSSESYPDSTHSVSFGYDNADRKTSMADGSGTTTYSYDNANRSTAIAQPSGTVDFSYDNADRVSVRTLAGVGGSIYALTNSSGSTTDTLVADAYGMTVTDSGNTPSPFGFVGQGGYQGDSDTGLMLLGHRYYDSSLGRFLSRDPIQAGYNWYLYCGNDPLNGTDPSRLSVATAPPAAIAGNYWYWSPGNPGQWVLLPNGTSPPTTGGGSPDGGSSQGKK